MKYTILFSLLLAFTVNAQEPLVFANRQQEVRFEHLTRQLRCLVCQNQDLADSQAELAGDLRQEVFELMQSGKSDAQIKQYLVDRYGDFVLYRPPLQNNTYLLWLLPLVLLLGGAWVVRRNIQQRTALLAQEDDLDTD